MTENLQQWLQELASRDVSQRRAAAERLAQLDPGENPSAIPLLDALKDDDDQVCEWVTAALEGVEQPAAGDVDGFARRLGEQGSDASYWAATLLGRAGPAATPAVAALTETLNKHPTLATRERAAWALGKIGPAAKSALPELKKAVDSGGGRLSTLAQAAIASIESSS